MRNFERKEGVPLIWVHAVSFGETKAVQALIDRLHTQYPTAQIVFSTATQTGYTEGKKALSYADHHFLLPYDFSWNAKRLVRKLQPTLFIQVETDFWFNTLLALKKNGSKIALVNGKMSDRSAKRHRLFPTFGRHLLSCFDLIALQSSHYQSPFKRLTETSLHVTGNLKHDWAVKDERFGVRERWGLKKRTIVIGSTHEGEERLILNQVRNLPDIQIALAPRHPERFADVERLIQELGFDYGKVSQNEKCQNLLLVDVMGELGSFYNAADVAIVGGSFIPGIGGHNIFEPMAFGTPTLFGPYMHNQKEMCETALKAEAALQLPAKDILSALLDEVKLAEIGEKGRALFLSSQGATEKTFALLRPFLDN